MFLVGILSWWYGRGWMAQWRRVSDRWQATVQFFSITQLLGTLFAPFRQISASAPDTSNPIAALRALLDQLISRCIGSIVRSFTIIFGLIVIGFQIIYETVGMILWWFIPILPVVGFILLAIGWVPTWM